MTHHTDAEQLHQLLELVLTELDRKAIPIAYMQEIDRKGKAFIEQAARRAPAAPVPQGWRLVPVESTEAMARAFRADDAPGYFCMTTLRCADFSERYVAMLAAAPQPPEAAPVQLPEAAATVLSKLGTTCMFPSAEISKGAKLYTEQQVRHLLAAHGIGKDKA